MGSQGMNLVLTHVSEFQKVCPSLDILEYLLSQSLKVVSFSSVPLVSKVNHNLGRQSADLGMPVNHPVGQIQSLLLR